VNPVHPVQSRAADGAARFARNRLHY